MRTIAPLTGMRIVPVLIAAFFGVPSPSHASIIQGSFTGTVVPAGTTPPSYDLSGVFGTASAVDAYAGAAVAGSFTYDTALAPPDLCDAATTGENCSDASAGGPGFNLSFLSVSLTINAHTVTFSNATNEVEVLLRSFIVDEFSVTLKNGNSATEDFDDVTLDVRSFIDDFITDPTTLSQNFAVSDSDGVFGTGSVFFDDNSSGKFANISFNIDSLTVGPQMSAVPEPSSLALVCVALAGLGAVGYRRSYLRRRGTLRARARTTPVRLTSARHTSDYRRAERRSLSQTTLRANTR